MTCLPGYGFCDPLYGNGSEEIFGFSISVAPNSAAVPEPASWALMLSGLALSGLALRRRGMSPA